MSDSPIQFPTGVNLAALAAAAHQEIREKIVWTSTNYWDQDGMRIEERKIVRGERPKDFPLYVVHAQVAAEVPVGRTPDGRIITQERAFPIHAALMEANNLDDVIAQAPAALQKANEEFTIEFEEKKKAALENAQANVAQNHLRRKLTEGLPGVKVT